MRLPLSRITKGALLGVTLALGGCASAGDFEPSSLLDFLSSKKPIPGERRPVFPEGVPGVQQGVPPELMRGANQPQQAAPEVITAQPEPPKPQQARRKTAAKAAKAPRRAAPPPPPEEPAEEGASAPAASSPFPDPPQSGSFRR